MKLNEMVLMVSQHCDDIMKRKLERKEGYIWFDNEKKRCSFESFNKGAEK
jgi:hypothetical protein